MLSCSSPSLVHRSARAHTHSARAATTNFADFSLLCFAFLSFIHLVRSLLRLSHLSSFSFATFQIRLSNSPDILMHRYTPKYPHCSSLSLSHSLSLSSAYTVLTFTPKTSKIYIRWILCFVGCCSFGSIFFCLLHFPTIHGVRWDTTFMKTNIIFIYFIGMAAPALRFVITISVVVVVVYTTHVHTNEMIWKYVFTIMALSILFSRHFSEIVLGNAIFFH